MVEQSSGNEKWLSLSQAAEQLSIHPTTLRRWADNGDIPVMLTPGGHRRFAAADVIHFAHERRRRRRVGDIEQIWAERAVIQTRREMVVHQDDPWLSGFDSEARARGRLMGQQLIGLMLQYLSAEDGGRDILQEARQIGRQYGRHALEAGMSLTEALQVSIFFRDALVESALQLPENVRIRPEANVRLLRRINTLSNTVHLAIAEVYDVAHTD